MKPAFLLFFIFVILAGSGICTCAAASPLGSANSSENASYWIHLDPVPDKHENDTFVITGTTNIPAGELIYISTGLSYFMPGGIPTWYWGDNVSIVEGSNGQNIFTTPPIQLTSYYSGGEYKKIRTDDDYSIDAEYKKDNSSVRGYVFYHILAPETVPPTLTPQPDDSVVYFFYGEGCTHCQNVIPFINNMTKKYPDIPIWQLEVFHNTTNQQILAQVNAAAGISYPYSVPEVVIGNVTLVGENEILEKMEAYLEDLEKKTDSRSPAGNSSITFGGSSSFSVFLPLLSLGLAGAICLLSCRKQP